MTDTDEITALRAENERLRAALKPILNYPNIRKTIGNQLYDLGRAALDGQHAPGNVEPRTDSRYNNAERIFGDD